MLNPQKRRSTLQPNEKIKKNKQTQILIELDKCLQIPHDDRLVLRKFVKQDNPNIISIFQQFRKDKSLTELQIKLRKFIQSLRFPQKKNHTLYQQNERNKTNQSQRIYSQNSQPTSYKNSLKCSPEKEDQKKKVINLDITELKKRIDGAPQSNTLSFNHERSNFERGNSKKQSCGKRKEISITKINTYLPQKKQKSLKRLDNLEKQQHQSSKSSLALQKRDYQEKNIVHNNKKQGDFSKITLRMEDKKYKQNVNQTPKQRHTGGYTEGVSPHFPLQDISQNYCYSSNIRNLLSAKLKEQKEPRKNSKILIQEEKTVLKTQQAEHAYEKQQPQQPKYTQMKTLIKKQAKPLHKDQYPCSVRLFDQSDVNIPMYLNSDSKYSLRNEANIDTVRDSFKKEHSYGEMKKSLKEGGANDYKKKETASEQQNFGKFFEKIKKIMENRNI